MIFQPEKLKECRTLFGLSQAELGKKMGVSAAAICQWENGVSCPRGRNLRRVAKVFNLSVVDFVQLEALEIK